MEVQRGMVCELLSMDLPVELKVVLLRFVKCITR